MSKTYRRIVLVSRPQGTVTPDNFRLGMVELPELQDGQVSVRDHFLPLDPYMCGRMNGNKSYMQPQPLGEVIAGNTVDVVEVSKNPSFAVGDAVVGMFGWREVGVPNGRGIQKVDTRHIPLPAYFSSIGIPGVTAWYGLNRIMHPRLGQTVAVSAASGVMGSVVDRLAKLKGYHVADFAGGKDKCDYVINGLGFDACIGHKVTSDAKELYKMLKEMTPGGIDSYLENVGGATLDMVLSRMNAFSRIATCGMTTGYSGQSLSLQNPQLVLVSRLTIEGFIVSKYMDVWPEVLCELDGFVAQSKLKFRENVAQGLASAPGTSMGLLKGKNFGKQFVKLVRAEPDTNY